MSNMCSWDYHFPYEMTEQMGNHVGGWTPRLKIFATYRDDAFAQK